MTSAPRIAHGVEAPDVTGCRGISCFGQFPGKLAVVRVPPPPSGMGATARYHRASPQGAELTARDITFSWLRRRGANVGNRESMSLLYKPVLIVTCVPQVYLWEAS